MELVYLIEQKPLRLTFKKYIIDDFYINLFWTKLDVEEAFHDLLNEIELKEELRAQNKKRSVQLV